MKRTLMLLIVILGLCMAAQAKEIEKGDYVFFGRYMGEKILWRCIDVNENGALIMSDKIISLKAFDAAGEQAGDLYGYRESGGGNLWRNSSIRAWLNSSTASVSYPSGHVPESSKMQFGINGYENEKGFLHPDNFTPGELGLIKDTAIKAAVSFTDGGGETPHNYNWRFENFFLNYEEADSDITSDKVFLPSMSEIKLLVDGNVRTFDNEYYLSQMTSNTYEMNKNNFMGLLPTGNWYYWLRDSLAYAKNNNMVRAIFPTVVVKSLEAYNDAVGIRPALYLDTGLATLQGGDGSAENPYHVSDEMYVELISDAERVIIGGRVQIKAYQSNIPEGFTLKYFLNGAEIDINTETVCEYTTNNFWAQILNLDGNTVFTSDVLTVESIKLDTEITIMNANFDGSNFYSGIYSKGSGDGGSLEPIEIDPEHGKSLLMTGYSAATYIISPQLHDYSGEILVECDVYFYNFPPSTIFGLKTQPGNAWITPIKFEGEGFISANSGSVNASGVLYEGLELEKWYNVKYIYDFENSTVTVALNDKVLLYNVPLKHKTYEYFDYVNINLGNSGEGALIVAFDNIKISTLAFRGNPLYAEITESGGAEYLTVSNRTSEQINARIFLVSREDGNITNIKIITRNVDDVLNIRLDEYVSGQFEVFILGENTLKSLSKGKIEGRLY